MAECRDHVVRGANRRVLEQGSTRLTKGPFLNVGQHIRNRVMIGLLVRLACLPDLGDQRSALMPLIQSMQRRRVSFSWRRA